MGLGTTVPRKSSPNPLNTSSSLPPMVLYLFCLGHDSLPLFLSLVRLRYLRNQQKWRSGRETQIKQRTSPETAAITDIVPRPLGFLKHTHT